MTGGDAIVAGLLAHGVDTVFGLPGAQVYGLFDAFERGGIRVVGARHEQGCGYMAFGYARSTGRPGVCAVVPGPGLLNASAALLTSLGANQPVLCLTGQVPTSFLGRGHGHLHEMPDQLATARGFTKWAERIAYPAQAPRLVAQAFHTMTTDRSGPALLEMPWDVFTRESLVPPASTLAAATAPPVDTDLIEGAADLIADARRPMILVGGGALDAGPEILALAERMSAPVVSFRSGRGIVSNAHDLGLTLAEGWDLWAQTDLVIGVGTRLELPRWRWPATEKADRRWIRVDIDPAEMWRFPCDVDIVADAKDAVIALLAAVTRTAVSADRRRDIGVSRAAVARRIEAVQPQLAYLRVLRDALPSNAIVTDEMSQIGFAAWFGFPVYEPRTFLSSGYQGTLGSGYGTALGAKVAHPDTPVVALCGDGGFMFAVQELATAVQYGIGVIALIFDNHAYGNVRRDQRESFEGRYVGADLVNPDFVRLGESFGVASCRVSSPAGLGVALARALADGGPALIVVDVALDSESNPWPFIQPSAR